MRSILHLIVSGLLVASLLSCRSTGVRTDWDTSVSFGEMRRYFWQEPEATDGTDPFADNALLRKRLRIGIVSAMAERGFVEQASPESADFVVTYLVVLDNRIRGDGVGWDGIGGYSRYGLGDIHSDFRIRNYQESTLIIDVLDAKSNQLIWRGWKAGVVGTRDQERSDAHVMSGIQEIIDAFPSSQAPVP